MDDPTQRTALLSAMTTEHFVLQTANSATYTEASARSTLYVMALSSSLGAMGFLANSPDGLAAFEATVLPAVFVLGLFTVARLVETGLESMHYLIGIARIRAFYRTLGPDAERLFAAESGRWPEIVSPAERLGPLLAFMGTTASMIAVVNNVVAGAGVALLVRAFDSTAPRWMCACLGGAATLALVGAFYAYQRWRFSEIEVVDPALR
jgi:hypothetical protein